MVKNTFKSSKYWKLPKYAFIKKPPKLTKKQRAMLKKQIKTGADKFDREHPELAKIIKKR